MRCPGCGCQEDRVLDTRIQNDGESIRRRRECTRCGERYSTLETLLRENPLVIKKDGRREPFSREKILRGLQMACQKRPVSLAQLEQIVERVSQAALRCGEREISSDRIGEHVVRELKNLDNVGYVRFASVYREFKDVREFVSVLASEPADQPAEV